MSQEWLPTSVEWHPQSYHGRLLTLREPYQGGLRATFYSDGQFRSVEGREQSLLFLPDIDLRQGGKKATFRGRNYWKEISYGKSIHAGTLSDMGQTRDIEWLPWIHGHTPKMRAEYEPSPRRPVEVVPELTFDDWFRPTTDEVRSRCNHPLLMLKSGPDDRLRELYYQDEDWLIGQRLWLHESEPWGCSYKSLKNEGVLHHCFDPAEWEGWLRQQLEKHLALPWTRLEISCVPQAHHEAGSGPRAEAHPGGRFLSRYGYYQEGQFVGHLLETDPERPRGRLLKAGGKLVEEYRQGASWSGDYRQQLSWEKWTKYALMMASSKPETPEPQEEEPPDPPTPVQRPFLQLAVQAASFLMSSLANRRPKFKPREDHGIWLESPPPRQPVRTTRRSTPVRPKPAPKRPAGRQLWVAGEAPLELQWKAGEPAVGGFFSAGKLEKVTYHRHRWARLAYSETTVVLGPESNVEDLAFPCQPCPLPLEKGRSTSGDGHRVLEFERREDGTVHLFERVDPFGWAISPQQRERLVLHGVSEDSHLSGIDAGHSHYLTLNQGEIWLKWIGPLEGASGYLGSFYHNGQLLNLKYQGDSFRDHLAGDRVSGYETGGRVVTAFLDDTFFPSTVRQGEPMHWMLSLYSRALGGGIWERFHVEFRLQPDSNTLVFDHVYSS